MGRIDNTEQELRLGVRRQACGDCRPPAPIPSLIWGLSGLLDRSRYSLLAEDVWICLSRVRRAALWSARSTTHSRVTSASPIVVKRVRKGTIFRLRSDQSASGSLIPCKRPCASFGRCWGRRDVRRQTAYNPSIVEAFFEGVTCLRNAGVTGSSPVSGTAPFRMSGTASAKRPLP